MRLFHYHLVASDARQVEERYLGKLAFSLVARYGYVGEEPVAFEPGTGWEELDRRGFRLRLVELQRGAVNVVVQPGRWALPRVDHVGIGLDDAGFRQVLGRATLLGRRVHEHGGRRTFVSTDEGYRLEIHPPRDWLEELFAAGDELRLRELHLRTDAPDRKARALAELLGTDPEGADVELEGGLVRFLPGGPSGRPELEAELFA